LPHEVSAYIYFSARALAEIGGESAAQRAGSAYSERKDCSRD